MQPPLLGTDETDRPVSTVKALYFIYYASHGVFFSFITVYYYAIGFSGSQIGLITAAGPLVAIGANLLWSVLNDSLKRPRLTLMITIGGAALASLAFPQFRSFAVVFVLSTLYQFFFNPGQPLIDSLTFSMIGQDGNDYGRIRVWGSVGFTLAAVVSGVVLNRTGLVWMFVANSATLLIALLFVKRLPDQKAGFAAMKLNGFLKFVRQADWVVFLGCTLLLFLGTSGLQFFLPVYLSQMGASESLIGLNWAIQAIAESVLMVFSAGLFRRLRLEWLLAGSFAFYGLRMALYSLIPTPGWALVIGLMHSVTYGLFWIAALNFVHRITPPELKTTGQGLFSACMGLSIALGSLINGWLYDGLGPVRLFQMDGLFCLLAAGLFVYWFILPHKQSAARRVST